MYLIIHFVCLLIFISFCDSYDLIVETKYGRVGGILKESRKGAGYYSFGGIPFAKPPVGDLRFANPEKPAPWNNIRNASVSSPRCIQRNYLFYTVPPIEGDEDCLYLNVYFPQRNDPSKKSNFPVVVSIPWGGYIAGGGDEGLFDPSYFMDHDIILVSINYRLGVFGFLSTLDDAAPGNFGLKDQVLALEWVQENIEFFGGLKNNVTIMGQSAGAGSTNLLMMSPSAKGLFHNAISQSGSAFALWATPANEVQKTVLSMQASLLNCEDAVGDSAKVIECLRKVPADVIAKSLDAFKTFFQYPLTPYTLVVENKTEKNPNPFLTKSPLEYVVEGEFQKVPWMTGTVKNEGLLIAQGLLGPEIIRKTLNDNFVPAVVGLLSLSSTYNDTDNFYKNISKEYLDNKNFVTDDEQWQQGFIDLWSDRYFKVSAYQAVFLQVAHGHDSIYFYSFEYAGKDTFAVLWGNGSKLYNPEWTTSHCDDLLYLFRSPDLFENQLTSSADQELSEIMVKLWVNFATYSNPNPQNNIVLPPKIKWEPLQTTTLCFSNDDVKLLNITGTYESGANFNITNGFIKDRVYFWEQGKVHEHS